MTTPNPNSTLETKRVPNDQLEIYFDRFTHHFLMRESTNAVDAEVLAPDWGAQFEAAGAHLLGITFDPKDNALEFEYEGGEHRIPRPKEVWTAEEQDGFVKSIEVVRDDGTLEVARVKRLGVVPQGKSPRQSDSRQQLP